MSCPDTVSVVSVSESNPSAVPRELRCGVAAGPVFVGGFAVIGAGRTGYDWRRHAVSSLAAGRGGWPQRGNFVLVGALYCIAADGLARTMIRTGLPRVVPAVVFGVGAGLIGSGVFVTDPVAGFPPDEHHADEACSPRAEPTLHGKLHNLCAIPIFVGTPVAAMSCAVVGAHKADYRWALYSAGSAVAMSGAFVLFARAFGTAGHAGMGGFWQRVSIATGFGWLSALSLRALISSRAAS